MRRLMSIFLVMVNALIHVFELDLSRCCFWTALMTSSGAARACPCLTDFGENSLNAWCHHIHIASLEEDEIAGGCSEVSFFEHSQSCISWRCAKGLDIAVCQLMLLMAAFCSTMLMDCCPIGLG